MNSGRPPTAWEAVPTSAGPPQQATNQGPAQSLPPLSAASGPPMAVAGPSTPVLAAPPPIPGDTQELHPELVAQGWRRLWSRRENRHYFWNHHTNQSLWELPPLPGARQQVGEIFGTTSIIFGCYMSNLNCSFACVSGSLSYVVVMLCSAMDGSYGSESHDRRQHQLHSES